ncbi:hypothetical protein, variant [Exophiala mesophila]|uniref:Uncharacterized protein n=1 Tax=Exophiala mesophila TaxID=212818 RepID=A0A0D1Z6G1_EXOME|nr:hypothetical protein, variant [Exophiala mesophila]KIV90432.1 hypothetical protein, variant [Exophiala mesophila]
MPPVKIPLPRVGQAVRSFASQSAGLRASHRLHLHHPLHIPSQRILAKAATSAQAHATSFPVVVRDATSYGALAVLTSGMAFSIYCWDGEGDIMDYFAL